MKVVVDNRLRVAREALQPEVEAALVEAFTHKNPAFAKKRAMGLSTWSERATICTVRMTTKQLTLPRGGTQQVREVLARFDARPDWDDRRLELAPVEMPRLKLALRDYQAEAVEAMVKRENCILRAPTGSGKTCAAFALIERLRQPSLVILWSASLLTQWKDRLRSDFGMRDLDIGIIRGARRSVKPITLAMQQSLWTKGIPEEVSGQFGLVLIDEVQRASAVTVRTVIDAFPARYRIGISASEKRKDGMDFLTREMFGPIAMDISRRQLVRDGTIHDVTVRVEPTDFAADWYGGDGSAREAYDFNRLLEEMTTDEDRNGRLVGIVRCEVEGGHRVLVFTHRIEHARWLSTVLPHHGIPCGLMLGGPENSVVFEETRLALLDGTLHAAVGTVQAIGQGLDLPGVDRGVVATPVAGNKQLFDQVRGRVCRMAEGKNDAVLVYLLDQRVYPGHLKNIDTWCDDVECDDGTRGEVRAIIMARQERRWGKRDNGAKIPGFDG